MSGRTPIFQTLSRLISRAHTNQPEGRGGLGRRELLGLGAGAAGAALLGGCVGPEESDESAEDSSASLKAINADIGIVGAGMAGLACAYQLKKSGCNATLHEANSRPGGRVWSLSGFFPGQVCERGGELIDTPHKTMIGYAQEFGLALEDITKPARDTEYLFGGQRYSEAEMVDQYRVLVDAMRDDLRAIGAPTAASFTPAEQALDNMSLREWLVSRGAPPAIRALLDVAYTIEYGLDAGQQSSLAFLLFAKASRQAKLRLWGNFSDERYHVVGGNQQIPEAIAARLPNQIQYGRRLLAVKKTAAGRVQLTFQQGSSTVTATHDAVVLTLPFTVLRDVSLHANLGLPPSKLAAIANVQYGTNAKLMVGFNGRPWVDVGSNGAAYSDLPYLQTTWETNPINATSSRAIITDYTGGALGASLVPNKLQQQTAQFLNNFDTIFPGAKALARKDASGNYVAHLEPWPSNPNTKGSYTANQTGYFTKIAGNEGPQVGNVYFGGETTDSFYSWQGFMEGAALSGLRNAAEILADFA
ncbi:MAG: FAD-dependent oxidoreductase [Polyangiaceae bacterium]